MRGEPELTKRKQTNAGKEPSKASASQQNQKPKEDVIFLFLRLPIHALSLWGLGSFFPYNNLLLSSTLSHNLVF